MTQRLDYQKLSAAGLRAFGGVYVYIVNSGLPKPLIDLVFLRASQINGCAYCIDMHSRDLLKGGASVEKVIWCRPGARRETSSPRRRRPPCNGPRR
jgi:AhpD family alkylhydroperoxidase